MTIYKNEFFQIYVEENDDAYIIVNKKGYEIKEFNNILSRNPRLVLSSFLNLKMAINNADGKKAKIGYLLPEIEVIISDNEMECKVKLNLTEEDISVNQKEIVTKIISSLNAMGIKEGIEYELLKKPLPCKKEILIAKGIYPVNGEDAKTVYYKLSEKRPELREDGSTNHYNLNLIDVVSKGDWVGEKIPATDGKEGKTVKGKKLDPKKGKDKLLRYDSKTIGKYEEEGKTIIRALIDGAVVFDKGKIKIENHLIINNDVDYSTGNLNFDGFITVNGTVKDGFSITAKYDISILSNMGIGATGKIYSKEGSIYIKGGVNGKNTCEIEAKEDVYVKYCNEAKILAGGKIDIGYYSLDCILEAEKIIVSPKNGKVIGGEINARSQIIAGTIGNKYERKTKINVQGFDRKTIKREFEQLLEKYKKLLKYAEDLKVEIDIYSFNFSISNSEKRFIDEYNRQVENYEGVIDEIAHLDKKRVELENILKSKGEGEISVLKGAYPKTFLQIKAIRKRINSLVKGTFFVNGRDMHFEQDI